MINRIREVRRTRNMTLDDVAKRCEPATTAQTIGRLETGSRTLSLDWLDRIAAAIGVDSAELVQSKITDQIAIVAQLDGKGTHALTRNEYAETPVASDAMVALRIATGVGDYRAGDTIWLRQIQADGFHNALNRDVLVPRPAGRFIFGRMIAHDSGKMQILPFSAGQRQQIVNNPPWIGIAERLIRTL